MRSNVGVLVWERVLVNSPILVQEIDDYLNIVTPKKKSHCAMISPHIRKWDTIKCVITTQPERGELPIHSKDLQQIKILILYYGFLGSV